VDTGDTLGRCPGMGSEFIVDERTAAGNNQIKKQDSGKGTYMRKIIARLPLGLVPLCAFMLCVFVTGTGGKTNVPPISRAETVATIDRGPSFLTTYERRSSRLLYASELVAAVGDSDMGGEGQSRPAPSSYCSVAHEWCISDCNAFYAGNWPWDAIQRVSCRTGCDMAYLWCVYFR